MRYVDLGIAGITDAQMIGRGASGTVYRARQPALDRLVAVKVLAGAGRTDRARKRFERERQVVGRLSSHPHIVTLYDFGVTADRRPYLLLDFTLGGSLADRITSGPLPWPEAVTVGIQIGGALETAHQAGVLHRDVKPANILMSEHGDAMLADFGVAALGVGDGAGTRPVGTAAFAAPELRDAALPSVVSDVYSLGATLVALLDGGDVPPRLRTVLDRATAADPTARFGSAEELGRALQEVARAEGEPVTSLRVPAGSGPAMATTRRITVGGRPTTSGTRPREIAVVSGPAAGTRLPLGRGGVVGRSADATFTIDDEHLSRRHFALHVQDGGKVEVEDLGSLNGTHVAGQPVQGRGPHPPGAVIEAGASMFEVRAGSGDATDDLDVRRVGGTPDDDRGMTRLPAGGPRPTEPEPASRSRWPFSRARPKPSNDPGTDATAAPAVIDAAPTDPAAVVDIALTPTPRLWERRPRHADFLRVHVGYTPSASGPRPTQVSLPQIGVLGVCGDRAAALALLRAVVAELLTLHRPTEVALVPFSSSEDAWAWLHEVPHVVDAGEVSWIAGTVERVQHLVAATEVVGGEDDADERLRTHPDRAAVLLIDGAAEAGSAAVLRGGPDAGIYAICVTDDHADLPRDCRASITCAADGRAVLVAPNGSRTELAAASLTASFAAQVADALTG